MVRLAPATILTALVGATVVSCEATTGYTQMVTYVKRRPDVTREEFWEYWQTEHAPKVAPLAAHLGISRYQQVQVGGMINPTEAGAEATSAELVSFDGIAMFLYESAEVLDAMLAHPYYIEVIEPDEHKFIDKEAPGLGQVATHTGTHIEVVEDKQSVWVGDENTRGKYQELFESYL